MGARYDIYFCMASARRGELPGGQRLPWWRRREIVRCGMLPPLHTGPHSYERDPSRAVNPRGVPDALVALFALGGVTAFVSALVGVLLWLG